MKKLFLDDVRMPGGVIHYIDNDIYLADGWIILRDHDEFVTWITENGLDDINLISFDHDLADVSYDPMTQREHFAYHEMTGMDSAKFLVDYCMDNDITLPEYLVHSANPTGSENIQCFLDNFKKFQDGQ